MVTSIIKNANANTKKIIRYLKKLPFKTRDYYVSQSTHNGNLLDFMIIAEDHRSYWITLYVPRDITLDLSVEDIEMSKLLDLNRDEAIEAKCAFNNGMEILTFQDNGILGFNDIENFVYTVATNTLYLTSGMTINDINIVSVF